MPGQLDPVCAERIGLDELRAGGNVRSVNFLDDLRLGQVELIEGSLEADAPGVKLGAHGAVAKQRALRKPFQERVGAPVRGCRRFHHGAQ